MNLRPWNAAPWPSPIIAAVALILTAAPAPAGATEPRQKPSPESRAVAFLAREVPLWSRENHCFSCHNNGDAARALYRAASAGYPVPKNALEDTTGWLRQPDRWEHNGGDGPFSDKKLARIAFATALATMQQTGVETGRAPLIRAADQLTRDQSPDGSWSIDGENNPGTPATYGRPLATWLCRQTLAEADSTRFRPQILQADAWLVRHRIETVTDASVALLAATISSPNPTSLPSKTPPRPALDLLKRAQAADDGGWGPFVTSRSEVFDTALAVLALAPWRDNPEPKALIARGRSFLIDQQQDDGSWIETTRPSGGVSYAQRISTTGWATLALLATPSDATTRHD
jgi:hypothetical protein